MKYATELARHEPAQGIAALRGNPWWTQAIDRLRTLAVEHGEEAERRALEHAGKYTGRRAAMVYDVVVSRQRRYESRVRDMVEEFEASSGARSLPELAASGPDLGIGLRKGEAETIRNSAAGLARYCEEHDLDEDSGVQSWAAAVAGLEHAHRVDPYVGAVKGIGPALFAYMRMRSGADTIKPDLRVKVGLRHLGFDVAGDPHTLLVVATAAAEEVGIRRLVLDQLLWWLNPSA